jgi:hypothetical protein
MHRYWQPPFPVCVISVVVTVLACDSPKKYAEQAKGNGNGAQMAGDAEFAAWIRQLDADLDREYKSHETDASGRITYVDLQESFISDRDLERVGRLAAIRHINISGNSEVTDTGLQRLSQLKDLEYLDIGFTSITDTGLTHLAKLTKLRSLLLNGLGEALTDKGLTTLRSLPQLEELRINSANVTDKSVATILGFKALKSLDISHTRITEEGVRNIRAALPNCKIERDSGA